MENNSLHKLGIDIGQNEIDRQEHTLGRLPSRLHFLMPMTISSFPIMSVILQISRRHLSPLSERPTTRQVTFQFVL